MFCFTVKGSFTLLYSVDAISASHEACLAYSCFNFHAIIIGSNQGNYKLKKGLVSAPRLTSLPADGLRNQLPVEAQVKIAWPITQHHSDKLIVGRVQTILVSRPYYHRSRCWLFSG